LYFAVTVFSTVGLGDIAAWSQPARIVVMIQILADLIYIGLLVRVLFVASQIGTSRRTDQNAPPRDQ
jgi:voltage-gated potassium channel